LTGLRNVAALVQKEWRHYFGSPIAYVAIAVWLLRFGDFLGYAFYYVAGRSLSPGGEFGGGAQPISLNDWLIGPVLHNMAVVTLFIAPMLTMRVFAEEVKQGTIELLATSPVTDLQIVLGKFFGALSVYAIMLVVSFLNFAWLWRYASSPPEWKPMVAGLLALLLLGASFIALCCFLSTLTRNQIVAGILSFSVFLGLWTLGWDQDPTAGTVMKAIHYLGLPNHMDDMFKGVLDLSDVVFYLSFISVGLFLTVQSVQTQRWRA